MQFLLRRTKFDFEGNGPGPGTITSYSKTCTNVGTQILLPINSRVIVQFSAEFFPIVIFQKYSRTSNSGHFYRKVRWPLLGGGRYSEVAALKVRLISNPYILGTQLK